MNRMKPNARCGIIYVFLCLIISALLAVNCDRPDIDIPYGQEENGSGPEPGEPENPDPDPNPDPEPGEWVSGTFFAPGVTRESGWYDVNKKKNGLSNGDFMLCWAASAACMVQCWQDYYKSKGYELPAGTPDGSGTEYELAVFEAIKQNFADSGAKAELGIHWYFTGEDRYENTQDHNAPKPGSGGYLKPVFDRIEAELGGDSYCKRTTSYYVWGPGRSDAGRSSLEILSGYIKDGLRTGAVGLTINVAFSSMHDITLWGCDVDDAGLVTAVWFTDSDDMISRPDAPREQIIHHLDLRDAGGNVYIVGHFCGDVQITAITTLKAYPVIGHDRFS